MKFVKLSSIALTTIIALSLVGCDSDMPSSAGKGMEKETAVEHALKHADPTYVCPMHPTIVQNEPGKCTICGMDLVKREPEEPASSGGEKKILYWVAPMDPNFKRDEPGKSPMGMDLVPVYDEGSGASVKISPEIVQNLGVRTAPAEVGKMWKRIDTVGYVDYDENMISHVHLRTDGWIEKLVIKSEGERVKKGELLFELYSPTLVNAQDEYIQALRSKNKRLIQASKDRLQALGVSKGQIRNLAKTRRSQQRVKIFAPQDGIVSNLMAREGMYVKPRMEIMTLADLSSIWIQVEVFERQAEWVQEDKPAEIRLSYLPGRVWEGNVEYVYPSLDPRTRTLKTRLKFKNPDESLKPNMFADVTIYGGGKSNVVKIPREALIRTGSEERVILSVGEGRFQPRQVVSGIESGDYIEIISGLDGGEQVVTSSQFLIDSEASIKASLNRMQTPQMDKSMDDKAMDSSKHVTGKGVIREVMPGESKLNMSHDPIPELGWPDMTMDFDVANDIKIDGLTPGTAIEFDMMEGKNGYEITAIRKTGE